MMLLAKPVNNNPKRLTPNADPWKTTIDKGRYEWII